MKTSLLQKYIVLSLILSMHTYYASALTVFDPANFAKNAAQLITEKLSLAKD